MLTLAAVWLLLIFFSIRFVAYGASLDRLIREQPPGVGEEEPAWLRLAWIEMRRMSS